MRQKLLLFLVLILGTLILFRNSPNTSFPNSNQNKATQPQPIFANEKTYLVTRVVDGDTIEIEDGKKVRYIGIDTPETVDPRKTVQCFGKEASLENKKLVEGKKVVLEKDISETDKYGRLLRYVYQNGMFINETLVAQGFARATSYPPDIKDQDKFQVAEKLARENNKGLWAVCN